MMYRIETVTADEIAAFLDAASEDGWSLLKIVASPFQSDVNAPIYLLVLNRSK